jgi:hypothetical protein
MLLRNLSRTRHVPIGMMKLFGLSEIREIKQLIPFLNGKYFVNGHPK